MSSLFFKSKDGKILYLLVRSKLIFNLNIGSVQNQLSLKEPGDVLITDNQQIP